MKNIVFVLIISFLGTISLFAKETIEHNKDIYHLTQDGRVIAWVYFADKGPEENLHKQTAPNLISTRALQRRQKVINDKQLINYSDYKIYDPYFAAVQSLSSKIRMQSRWLNATSIETTVSNLKQIEAFDFVEKVTPVRASRKRQPQPERISEVKQTSLGKATALDYGLSYDQVTQINTHLLHEKGLYGTGVLVCLLDDGFNLLNHHVTFDSINVQATWDFINNDASVDDSEYQATEGWHGTKTLSTIAGYTPGTLIGTAFKATYILGKTEVDGSETQVEEDYWVAGIEWAENLGADIVSSSLGYIDWYTPAQLDGATAVTTIAADLAVEKGMVVFNSAGNENDHPDHNTLIAPADGDNVFAIGAVTSSGARASFSSVGPTADGRIKPDIAAMGGGVTAASTTDDTGFSSYNNGTSYSCPIAAGAAALLLEAFPNLTPAQLYLALRTTASQSENPDKYLGWGIMDVSAAYNFIDTSGLEGDPGSNFPQYLELKTNYPNPFNPYTTIKYRIKNSGYVVVKIYNLQGRIMQTYGPRYESVVNSDFKKFPIQMNNFASGVYVYQVELKEAGSGRTFSRTGKMVLMK